MFVFRISAQIHLAWRQWISGHCPNCCLGYLTLPERVNQAEVATLSRNYQTCDVIYTYSTEPNCNGGQCRSIRLGPKQGCGHHSGIQRLTDSSSLSHFLRPRMLFPQIYHIWLLKIQISAQNHREEFLQAVHRTKDWSYCHWLLPALLCIPHSESGIHV